MRDAVQTATPKQRADSSFWEATLRANDAMLADDATCGETTLVVVCVTPTHLVGASIGDSEAWWVHDEMGGPTFLTEGSLRKPYLGYGAARPVGFSLRTPPTGTLLVATDGLFKYTSEEQIVSVLHAVTLPLPDALAALRDAVRGSSCVLYDDFAAVLLRREPA